MLVISICDEGSERNFACTAVNFEDDFVVIISEGITYRFRTAEIMEIAPVYNSEVRRGLHAGCCC